MKPRLSRILGFWALAAYGVGDILGGGIYALVGKVAGAAGPLCWASFAIAMGVALLTALSYAELVSRFPKSGGAAVFSQEAFRAGWLAFVVGWMVLCSGIFSMATVSHAFAGYLGNLLPVPARAFWVAPLFLAGLSLINFRGIKESVRVNALCTLIELFGLAVVVAAGAWFLSRSGPLPGAEAAAQTAGWQGLFQGAALAFFAMVGFEDMVNIAEESKDPEREIPKAMLTAVTVAGLLYVAVSFVSSRVLPAQQLAGSEAPLLAVVQRAWPLFPGWLFAGVALFAVSNTALLNSVMSSRLLYGMAQDRLIPAWFGSVHPSRHTPHHSILTVLAVSTALALSGTILQLAGATSTLVLLVFTVVNIALLKIKRDSSRPQPSFRVPWPVPALGIAASLWLLTHMPPASLAGASGIVAAGLVLTAVVRLSRVAARKPAV